MSETLVRMPKLADTLVEGTVGQWLKRVGETVGRGEPLVSIETDKVTTDMASPAAGTLLEQLVPEGETVPVETVIARIGEAAVVNAAPSTLPPPLTGDAQKEAEGGAPAPLVVPLTPMRRAIADHMLKARQTIPHGQTIMDADLTRLVAWRDSHKAAFQNAENANLSFTVLFVYALARKLASDSGRTVDLGVAVALDAGLIVPVLRNAGSLTLGATARGIRDLAARARGRTLTPDETLGAQMTVTNVGSFGNLTASPIVPIGQVGILGPGLVERRPMPGADGGIRPGWRCRLCLMFDRRALDDFAADRMLRGILNELQRVPEPA